MKQLTIRGLDGPLERSIRELARRAGTSLNKAAMMLMRRGAGLAEPDEHSDRVGGALDHLAGTWSEADEREFRAATVVCESVDEDLWK